MRVGAIVCSAAGMLLVLVLAFASLLVLVIQRDQVQAANVAKIAIALTAAGFVLLDLLLGACRVRVPEPARIAVGVVLALTAVVAYFDGFKIAYAKYYHRWEFYHSYLGARYFPELGYNNLYRCTVVAEDELGVVTYPTDAGATVSVDLSKEARNAQRRIRDIGHGDSLIPASIALSEPEVCKSAFRPERWEQFKNDVLFFRGVATQSWFDDMQKDHGFHLSPVWMILGRPLASLHGPTVPFLQLLSFLDLVFLLGVFGALWWAFGWRVSVIAAVVWGCQPISTFYWTGGAYLRHDWLFFLVLAVCLMRRRWWLLGGAALAYASLISVFPVYSAIGMGVFAVAYAIRTKRLAPGFLRTLAGFGIGAAVLVCASLLIAGPKSYTDYWSRREDRASTPLTNHVGLGAVMSHGYGNGPDAGRMKYSRDNKLPDPFANWKRMRLEQRERLLPTEVVVDLFLLGVFALAMWRMRSLWASVSLGQLFIVALALLTCQNYAFLLLGATLTRLRRWVEVVLLLFCAIAQLLFVSFFYIDDRYTALSAATVLLVAGLAAIFVRYGFARKPAANIA